jgi:hypothetical protein
MPQTYKISFNHAACVYPGDTVLLDDNGTPHKWNDVGLTHDVWIALVEEIVESGAKEVTLKWQLVTK